MFIYISLSIYIYTHICTGAFRAKFILESLASLKKRLRDLGSDLLVAVGRTEQQLAEIAERTRATCIITEQQLTDEELRMDKSVRSAVAGSGAELEEVWIIQQLLLLLLMIIVVDTNDNSTHIYVLVVEYVY